MSKRNWVGAVNENLAALADQVRAARKRKRWGQQELARRADVSLGVVSNLERKLTRPQPANERAILTALGIETQDDAEYNEEERRSWPRDVSVVLDVMGLFLSGIPEEDRANVIHDLTRWMMNHPSRRG
jgi:transcriptional regulator with XRE-family HTH domain